MALLFLDTSALVRRYDRAEPGASRVVSLCRPALNNALFIAEVTALEVASAFHRKYREGRITLEQRDRLWLLFGRHRRRQYRGVSGDAAVYELGKELLFRHPLRAYDALQLASALSVSLFVTGFAADLTFCTADRAQARVAVSEGLPVQLIS